MRGAPRCRPAAAILLALALVACGAASPLATPVGARDVATLRAGAPLAGSGGFVGLDLEREQPSGSAWLVGVSLQPSGLYGGLRRYVRPTADRPFYGAGIGLELAPDGEARPSLWVEGGYELRLDRNVRALAGAGLALSSDRWGLTRSRLLLQLGLGLVL